MNDTNLSISNVVGGGDIGNEIDLAEVYADLDISNIEYEPEHFPGLIIKFREPKATVMLFTSGKYNIAGAESYIGIEKAKEKFLSKLEQVVGKSLQSDDFEIRFVVCTADLGTELDLAEVMVALGAEETEYEPEQFPALFYRPKNENWFALMFRTGKIIVEGGPELDTLEEGYESIRNKLKI